jgi:CubicO group peptidase (beta-lactamase class C family)
MKYITTFAAVGLALAVTYVAAPRCLVGFAAAAGEPATTDAAAVFPGKHWAVSTPEEQGMDSARLARLVENIGNAHYDSLTIVRNGRIVLDAYYAPFLPGISHDLRSVTKSVTGTLTAIEIAHGLLDSVDRKVLDLFPDKQVTNIDNNKKAITVQNLLDMTSGFAWTEKKYTPRRNRHADV